MDWIIGFGLIGYLWAICLYLCWYVGDYEHTGLSGWRRIPAGAMLAVDVWRLWINRWLARLAK